ncbi:hypothetical protein MRB53_032945 [Persea americana]|uniref:Uncharacterized protein n=1 Tax=Persea americana TaxID=3435 RepID=A0ACC2KTL1_PERAE|nr:hypothetical protein MRB53_032945 [Persea americana]
MLPSCLLVSLMYILELIFLTTKFSTSWPIWPFKKVIPVLSCSAVSWLACVPLGKLFFFHMKLIRKGITTYGYVVAMRAMSEALAGSIDDDNQNVIYSPSGSATTGFSGGSSLGLQYKGAWCTTPRVFVDHQLLSFYCSVVPYASHDVLSV